VVSLDGVWGSGNEDPLFDVTQILRRHWMIIVSNISVKLQCLFLVITLFKERMYYFNSKTN